MQAKGLTDVLIVGGGPAGLAAAIALRQKGATVTVVDARQPPIDKACGEGLMPDALDNLSQIGVDLSGSASAPFCGIRFVDHQPGGHKATADFATSQARANHGVGITRQALHTAMVATAQAIGVNFRWQSRVDLSHPDRVELNKQPIAYSLLIGADGTASRVRRWANLERGATYSRRYGFRQHFQVDPSMTPSPSHVEVHWGRLGQAYITPVSDGLVSIATVARDPHHRLHDVLEDMPQLREQLQRCSIPVTPNQQNPIRGALTTTRKLSHVVRGRVVLVGDASGSVDAVTGEGMGLAFRQALLLAECAAANDLARYNRLHASIQQSPQTMARTLVAMDRHAGLRRRAIAMLANHPDLFRRMLGIHLGEETMLPFLLEEGPAMLWKLAVPQRTRALSA
jgi:flavin-dependent dehydrogenase